MATPRMTLQVQLVLAEMLSEPAEPRYGLDMSAATGLPSGTIYPRRCIPKDKPSGVPDANRRLSTTAATVPQGATR